VTEQISKHVVTICENSCVDGTNNALTAGWCSTGHRGNVNRDKRSACAPLACSEILFLPPKLYRDRLLLDLRVAGISGE
jgi:hypothetical protein